MPACVIDDCSVLVRPQCRRELFATTSLPQASRSGIIHLDLDWFGCAFDIQKIYGAQGGSSCRCRRTPIGRWHSVKRNRAAFNPASRQWKNVPHSSYASQCKGDPPSNRKIFCPPISPLRPTCRAKPDPSQYHVRNSICSRGLGSIFCLSLPSHGL
jgi:hypothetical protein